MGLTTEQEFGQNVEADMRSAADELERITEKVIKGVGMNAVESKYCQCKYRLRNNTTPFFCQSWLLDLPALLSPPS